MAAEDPVEALERAYRSQLAAFQAGRRGIAEVLASEKRLELEVNALGAAIGRALEREASLSAQRERLRDELADVQTRRRGLEELVDRLGQRVEDLRTQKIALAARYATARAGGRLSVLESDRR